MYFQKPSVNRLINFFDTASIQSISESMMNHETHLLTNKTLYSVPINPTVPLLFQLPVMQYYSETEFIVERSQYQSTSPAAFQQVHLAIQQADTNILIPSVYPSSHKLIYAAYSDYIMCNAVPNSNIFLGNGNFSKLKYSLHFSLHDIQTYLFH